MNASDNISSPKSEMALMNSSMLFYYLIIPTPIGIVTNFVGIYAFTRKSLNKTNMGIYNVFIGSGNILVGCVNLNLKLRSINVYIYFLCNIM
jgi:hypothetical protein